MPQPPRIGLLLAFACCLFLSAGCGGKPTVTVKGDLVLPKDLKLAKDDSVTIAFVPEGEGGRAVVASFDSSTNSFVARKVAVGKNKVTVMITLYPGPKTVQQTQQWIKDNIDAVFNGQKTPLTYDAPASPSEQNITIDLVKKTLTAK
jgi:hypothetical protein